MHALVPSSNPKFYPKFLHQYEISLSLGGRPNKLGQQRERKSWSVGKRLGLVDTPSPTKGIEKGEIVKELWCNVTIRRPVIGKSTFPHLLLSLKFHKIVV
jgi:hypothetical protein